MVLKEASGTISFRGAVGAQQEVADLNRYIAGIRFRFSWNSSFRSTFQTFITRRVFRNDFCERIAEFEMSKAKQRAKMLESTLSLKHAEVQELKKSVQPKTFLSHKIFCKFLELIQSLNLTLGSNPKQFFGKSTRSCRAAPTCSWQRALDRRSRRARGTERAARVVWKTPKVRGREHYSAWTVS